MNLLSSYKSMENSASLSPLNTNLKLIIRHAENCSYSHKWEDVELTESGKIASYQFGESFDLPLGFIATSFSSRCQKTCEVIKEGFYAKNSILQSQIFPTKILQESHVKDREKSKKHFEELHVEGIFNAYATGIELDGLYSLSETVRPMLRFVFGNGNLENTLDLFCTHDIQIELILLFIGYDKDEISECWPRKLEGLFLWQDSGTYYSIWRGVMKEFSI